MPNRFFFADEAGDFEFTRAPRISRYFILCTVSMDDCAVGDALLKLRRKLAWAGADLRPYFHCCEDKQAVRDAVFSEMLQHPFEIQATIMEKAKCAPSLRPTRAEFYRTGWLYHFRHGANAMLTRDCEALVTTASLGTKKEQRAFNEAVRSVMRNVSKTKKWNTDFCPASADPCLQVADYCAWAIQRKWESPNQRDTRSYKLIEDRITYEYELWKHGRTFHY